MGVTCPGQSSEAEKRESGGGSRAQGSSVRLQGSEVAALHRDLEQPHGSGGPLTFSRSDSDGLPWSPLWTGMTYTCSKNPCTMQCSDANHMHTWATCQILDALSTCFVFPKRYQRPLTAPLHIRGLVCHEQTMWSATT